MYIIIFFFIVFQGRKSYTVQSVRSFVRLYCHDLTNLEYFQLRKRLKRKMLSVSYIIEQKTNSANYLLASAQIDRNFSRLIFSHFDDFRWDERSLKKNRIKILNEGFKVICLSQFGTFRHKLSSN